MSIIYTFDNKVLKNSANDKWFKKATDPCNPLGLPANTIRAKFSSGYTPTMGDTQTLVDANNNVWDIYKQSNNWSHLFNEEEEKEHVLLKVLGANTSNVTQMTGLFRFCKLLTTVPLFDTSNVRYMPSMFRECSSLISVPLFNTSKVRATDGMFRYCTSLTSVPLFDTSNVTNMKTMFNQCSALTTVPLFNTSKVTNMDYTFNGCSHVDSGALALYQQASSQTTPPTNHDSTFNDCGNNSDTGRVELAQIPSSWGGLA